MILVNIFLFERACIQLSKSVIKVYVAIFLRLIHNLTGLLHFSDHVTILINKIIKRCIITLHNKFTSVGPLTVSSHINVKVRLKFKYICIPFNVKCYNLNRRGCVSDLNVSVMQRNLPDTQPKSNKWSFWDCSQIVLFIIS